MAALLYGLSGYLKTLGGIAAQAVSADTSSNAIDTAETPEELLLVANVGECTDGAYVVKLLTDDS